MSSDATGEIYVLERSDISATVGGPSPSPSPNVAVASSPVYNVGLLVTATTSLISLLAAM
jgi:hypothetical protein